jgi:hypothetical protein
VEKEEKKLLNDDAERSASALTKRKKQDALVLHLFLIYNGDRARVETNSWAEFAKHPGKYGQF